MVETGDIIIVNFEPVKGHEQGGTRPAVVIQNNLGNMYSPLTIVAPLTSKHFNLWNVILSQALSHKNIRTWV